MFIILSLLGSFVACANNQATNEQPSTTQTTTKREKIAITSDNIFSYIYKIDVSFTNVSEQTRKESIMGTSSYIYVGDIELTVTPKDDSYEFENTRISVTLGLGSDRQSVSFDLNNSGTTVYKNSIQFTSGLPDTSLEPAVMSCSASGYVYIVE